jgi:predicted RNA-binding Zn ribbon-like protein
MEQSTAFSLTLAFLNAKGAFEDPLAAAQWWGGVRNGAFEAPPLAGAPKPRFDASMALELRTLQTAALETVGEVTRGGRPSEASVAVISGALRRGTMQLHGNPPAVAYSVDESAAAVLFPLALAIASLIAADLSRLCRCANESCAAYFWDNTKNGSRRWCGLPCMERARAPRRRLRR